MGKKNLNRLPEKQSTLVKNFRPKNEKQQNLVNIIKNNEITIASGPAGTGKSFVTLATALELLGETYKKVILIKSVTTLPGEELGFLKGPQPLYAKVSTPGGWKFMGDLKINDIIHAYDGSLCNITNISERNYEDIYKITLSDGRVTFASAYHKWFVEVEDRSASKSEYKTVTTLDMINDHDKLYFVPLHKAVEYNYSKLDLHPYLLGVLLGDGSISGSHVRFASNDNEIIERVKEIVSMYGLSVNKSSDSNVLYTISEGRNNPQKGARILARKNILTEDIEILGTLKEANFKFGYPTSKTLLLNRCTKESTVDNWRYFFTGEVSGSANYVKNCLEDLNLMGKKSYEKHIPEEYLYASKEDRIELLHGLMDTDGSIKSNKKDVTYTTTSRQLANDLKQLVESLGGLAKITEYNYVGREQELNNNTVVCQRICYVVYLKFYDNEINPFSLLRKAERFIPKMKPKYSTKIKSIQLIGKDIVQCITIDHHSNLYLTDNFIPTHNSLSDKMEPYMFSYKWNVDKICGEKSFDALVDKGLIEILPLAFIRGITIDDAIVILDESQNFTAHTFKSIMSRIGENVKYIFLGDTEQIDMKKKQESFLKPIIDLFSGFNFVGTLEFTDEDCVRNPLIPKILDILRNNGY